MGSLIAEACNCNKDVRFSDHNFNDNFKKVKNQYFNYIITLQNDDIDGTTSTQVMIDDNGLVEIGNKNSSMSIST